jgi:DNA-directed RNA polymerase subunit RPC12/RpoP
MPQDNPHWGKHPHMQDDFVDRNHSPFLNPAEIKLVAMCDLPDCPGCGQKNGLNMDSTDYFCENCGHSGIVITTKGGKKILK